MQKLTLNLIVISLLSLFAATSANAQPPTWQGSFVYQGTTYAYTMVGSNPANGGATYIPVEIIPIDLQFVASNGSIQYLYIDTPMCHDPNTGVTLTQNSPLFQNYPFYSPLVNGVFLGNTQYTDAFQRASFWNQVSANGYHVMLTSVSVLPPQIVTVSSTNGSIVSRFLGCTTVGGMTAEGKVDRFFFNTTVQNLITSLGISSGVLPIFLVRNTLFTSGTGGTIIEGGFHLARGVDPNTYIVASFDDPEIFGSGSMNQDTYFLSHELAEWMDDPFLNNSFRWVGGQVSTCQTLIEVGDPLTGFGFTASLNGFTYHLSELAMLPWFSREMPSSAVNGWYSFPRGALISPSSPC
jgi:hypothetical protein